MAARTLTPVSGSCGWRLLAGAPRLAADLDGEAAGAADLAAGPGDRGRVGQLQVGVAGRPSFQDDAQFHRRQVSAAGHSDHGRRTRRPGQLAVARVTTLARLVAQVREETTGRLWSALESLLTVGQRLRPDQLVGVAPGSQCRIWNAGARARRRAAADRRSSRPSIRLPR